jgi:DNA repair exonuclease SbcCD ATPase subunit
MEDSSLNNILAQLGETVNTIDDKVNYGKAKVVEYKRDIMERLNGVLTQLKELQTANINALNSIPDLKEKLSKAQKELQQKTNELSDTKTQLESSNRSLKETQERLTVITQELEKKTQELETIKEELATEQNKTSDMGKEKDAIIQKLDEEIIALKQQKTEAETELDKARKEIDSLVQKLTVINNALAQKIKLIDTIAGEFGENKEVLEGFKAISDSIQAIMFMLNNPETISRPSLTANSTTSATPLYDKFMALTEEQQGQIYEQLKDIPTTIPNKTMAEVFDESIKTGDNRNVENILKKYKLLKGGKRRRRTMKKRPRKTYKKRQMQKQRQRGGYVYSSNKKLDDASSVVSASSEPISRTRSRLRRKNRTKRKVSTK